MDGLSNVQNNPLLNALSTAQGQYDFLINRNEAAAGETAISGQVSDLLQQTDDLFSNMGIGNSIDTFG